MRCWIGSHGHGVFSHNSGLDPNLGVEKDAADRASHPVALGAL